jgi:hypothetical protein
MGFPFPWYIYKATSMYSDKWRLFQDLKDRNDELTAEIESVKHLLPNIKGKAGTPLLFLIPETLDLALPLFVLI